MSSHRKIEWALAVLGALGLLVGALALQDITSIVFGVPFAYHFLAVFSVVTFFAILHVFHLFDGKRANQVIIAASGVGIVLCVLSIMLDASLAAQQYWWGTLILTVAVAALALVLHRDFRK